jgi:hypothetical protein
VSFPKSETALFYKYVPLLSVAVQKRRHILAAPVNFFPDVQERYRYNNPSRQSRISFGTEFGYPYLKCISSIQDVAVQGELLAVHLFMYRQQVPIYLVSSQNFDFSSAGALFAAKACAI